MHMYGTFTQALIRPFREHHIDPTSITRHDFVETNGDNFAACVPALAYMVYRFATNTPEQTAASYNWFMFTFLLAIFVSSTNQVGKTISKEKRNQDLSPLRGRIELLVYSFVKGVNFGTNT